MRRLAGWLDTLTKLILQRSKGHSVYGCTDLTSKLIFAIMRTCAALVPVAASER